MNQPQRLRHGIRTAFLLSGGFCLIVSTLVAIFAEPLLLVFLKMHRRSLFPSA